MTVSSIIPSILSDTLAWPFNIWSNCDISNKDLIAGNEKNKYQLLKFSRSQLNSARMMLKAFFRIALTALGIFAMMKYRLDPALMAVGGLLISTPAVCLAGGTYVGYLAINTIIKAIALNSLNLSLSAIGLSLASWALFDNYKKYERLGILERPVIHKISGYLKYPVIKATLAIGVNFCCYKPTPKPDNERKGE